jgi:hypothetical protein
VLLECLRQVMPLLSEAWSSLIHGASDAASLMLTSLQRAGPCAACACVLHHEADGAGPVGSEAVDSIF